ncbi:hypothetical protein ACFFRR_001322 [Megaselia abdita]
MSSDSDSDDENLKNILQAVDTNLLNNSLFIKKTDVEQTQDQEVKLKSQRYLNEDVSDWLNISQETKDFMHKKLSNIISEQFEFTISTLNDPHTDTKYRNRVKLLSDCKTGVQAYEDIVEEFIGPKKKPDIKRRKVEPEYLSKEERLKASVINAETLLEDKIFEKPKQEITYKYKTGKDGTCHFLEPNTEFTTLRKKNNWSEKKISRNFKK